MKIIKYVFFTKLLLLMVFFPLQAQNTQGNEFWLTFGKNRNYTPASINNFNLQIRLVSGEQPTLVTISFTDLETVIDYFMNPYEVYTYSFESIEKIATYNFIEGTSNKSIHITSTEPITAYALNQSPFSTDATNILPLTALGTEYYNISYYVAHYNPYFDAYAVIAIQNNTELYHNGILETILDSAQVYYRTSEIDMTGVHITANNPVAFFAVCQGTFIPEFYTNAGVLMQQLAPINTWGKNFFVPVSNLSRDIARIVASQNNTKVTQTGGVLLYPTGGQTSLDNLQAGEFVELVICIDSAGCSIQSDKPVGVCTYFTAPDFSSLSSTPAQCWLPAIEQKTTQALIAPFVPKGLTFIDSHYALITTQTATKNSTMVSIANETAIPVGGIWIDNDASGMSFYNMPLTNDTASYYFTNPDGLIILGYGTGLYDTYYYLAGSAMRDLNAAFYANDIHYWDLKDNYFCDGFVEFRAEIEGLHQTAQDRIMWFVDGTEEPGTLNQETWSKTFNPGTYDIRMWVRYENDDTISKTGTLIIKNCSMETEFYANNVRDSILKDTTFCNKSVNFRAEIEEVFSNWVSIKWYVDYGSGEVEETSARDQLTWSKDFDNGIFPIKMVVVFANGETATRTGILKIQALWIKMRNVRY